MAQQSKVEVINRFGWRKELVVEKPIIQIGRDARNDIVLDDGHESDIAPRHAQLLPSTLNHQGMRLINLSDREITVLPAQAAPIAPATQPAPAVVQGAGAVVAPRSSAEIAGGDQIKMGGFTLIFHGGEAYSGVMKLSLELASTILGLERPLEGALRIHHVGNKAAVQFKIELEGLDPDAYEVGPGPVLFPNAEKEVPFRLVHTKRPFPPAGAHRITFHVTAPDAYPGERASISQEIQVSPYYRHKMRVVMADALDYRLT
jgi:hypothetical protein